MNDNAVLPVYDEALPVKEVSPGLYQAESGVKAEVTADSYFRSVPLFAEPLVKPKAKENENGDR
jgi:hypothetical protein